jgi:hypothetical protein
MAGIRFLGVHRIWQDWIGLLFGVLIGLSPWFAGQMDSQAVMWNAVIVGAAVIALAALEFVDLQRWEEVAEGGLSLWLILSPFVFGYAGAGTLRFWHFALGGIVLARAAFELWQDWSLSDKDLARHG